jgi:hypothetical protein
MHHGWREAEKYHIAMQHLLPALAVDQVPIRGACREAIRGDQARP